MAEEIKKTTVKKTMTEQEKLAAQKQKEKEKAKLAAQKQKEKEKAKLAAQKQKEKEKAKLAAQKEKEKEKAKLAAQKEKEKAKASATKTTGSKTSTAKKTPLEVKEVKVNDVVEETVVKDVKVSDIVEETVVKEVEEVKNENVDVTPKTDFNKLFEAKKKLNNELPKTEEGLLADEKPTDHVAILKKKMEAQKKLKENASNNPLELDPLTNINSSSNDKELEEQIKKLEETIAMLTDAVKEKDALINKQDLEIKDKGDQIVILTNSIVTKTNEAELLKELDLLKKENESLKVELENKAEIIEGVQEVEESKEDSSKEDSLENRVDINSPEIQEIIAQGDILLRIKLLNQRISEKDAKIQLVEDELNKLTEKDIVAMSFTQQIKALRETRRETVDTANHHLKELTEQITNEELKLNSRKEEYLLKENEIKAFDKNLSEQRLTYTEKEEQMKIRSRMIAEYDSLGIKVNELEDNFKKLVNRYKKILRVAEDQVDNFNKYENDLISLYLKQLREFKTSNNEDYKENIEERNNLLVELDKLNKIYQEMKANNMFDIADEINAEELDAMKKEYAKLTGKLNMIDVRYQERMNVEEVLRTIDPDVSSYLKAFEEREKLIFDINELRAKLADDNQEQLEIIINDYQAKVKYLDVIVGKNENHEKVVFYKQLLKSIEEIKDKEAAIKIRVQELKEKIEEAEKE